MSDEVLRQGTRNMLVGNMNLKEGETVLFVTDVPQPHHWTGPAHVLTDMLERSLLTRQVYDLAREEFPGCPATFMVFPATGKHGTEPPDFIAEEMLKYDVVILMTSFSLSHTDARVNACKKGARIASMPDIEKRMFLEGGPMQADYYKVREECNLWAQRMTACKQVHVTTPEGTDITFSLEGRKGEPDHGLFHTKGEWGNLPAGEAFIAPLEGTANGTLVAPAGWYPRLSEDFIMTFKDGYVVSAVGGGEVGDKFRNLFQFGDPAFLHRRNCAELGIGTNPNAHKPDNVLEAEKIRGTIHIAVGDNAHMEGTNTSDIHEDFIIPHPTVTFDGVKMPVGE